jgi:hypothetical protein
LSRRNEQARKTADQEKANLQVGFFLLIFLIPSADGLSLQRDLNEANGTLSLLQQHHTPSPDANAVAQASEITRLRAQIDELGKAVSNLNLEKDTAIVAKKQLEDSVRSCFFSISSFLR